MTGERSLFNRLSEIYRRVFWKATCPLISFQLLNAVIYFLIEGIRVLTTKPQKIAGFTVPTEMGDSFPVLLEHRILLFAYAVILSLIIFYYALLPRLLVYWMLPWLDCIPLQSLLFDELDEPISQNFRRYASSWALILGSVKPESFEYRVLQIACLSPWLFYSWYGMEYTKPKGIRDFLRSRILSIVYVALFVSLWYVSGAIVSLFESTLTIVLGYVFTFIVTYILYATNLVYNAYVVRIMTAAICKHMTDRWPWEEEYA
jgi:hypothetical protein